MKPLELEYSDWRDGCRLLNGYSGFVDSFEVEVLAFEAVGDYQGDYHWLLYDPINREYAFLTIGYGSCSGCDWLEAMEGSSEKEYIEARDDIWNGLIWQSATRMLEWLTSETRKHDFSWFEEGYREFINECIRIMLRKGTSAGGPGLCPSCMIPDCADCWRRGCECECQK